MSGPPSSPLMALADERAQVVPALPATKSNEPRCLACGAERHGSAFSTQIKDNANDPAAVLAIAAQIEGIKGRLAAAVVANTPAVAPPTPAQNTPAVPPARDPVNPAPVNTGSI